MRTIKKDNHICYRNLLDDDIVALLQVSLDSLKDFESRNGYQLRGEFPGLDLVRGRLHGRSNRMKKMLVKWHFRLQRRCTLRTANAFLRFMSRKLLEFGPEQAAPRIDCSEQELAIKAARKAWVAARNEAERLRLAYQEEKGDFYRR